jgi:hypothetical protein
MPKPEGRSAGGQAVVVLWAICFVLGFMLYKFREVSVVRFLLYRTWDVMNRMVPSHWNPGAFVFFVVLVLAVTLVAITIHELAHAIVGVLAGFRFNSLRISRLQFDRPFRVSLYKGRGTGAGGWASLFPVKQNKLILRAVVMLLAGPFSNLLCAGLLVALPHSTGMFSALLIYISFLLGLMNLIPFRSRAVISDGGRIAMLLANRARGERWLSILKLVEELRTGVPAENMTPEFIAKAVAIEDKSPDTVTAFAIAYAAAFWQHKDDEAARLLEACLRNASVAAPSQRTGLITDAAVFQARRRKRIDLAEQWLADLPPKLEYPWLPLRGQAAILEARGDIAGALRKLDEVEKLLLAVPNQALREMSLRNLKRWKAELKD